MIKEKVWQVEVYAVLWVLRKRSYRTFREVVGLEAPL